MRGEVTLVCVDVSAPETGTLPLDLNSDGPKTPIAEEEAPEDEAEDLLGETGASEELRLESVVRFRWACVGEEWVVDCVGV